MRAEEWEGAPVSVHTPLLFGECTIGLLVTPSVISHRVLRFFDYSLVEGRTACGVSLLGGSTGELSSGKLAWV